MKRLFQPSLRSVLTLQAGLVIFLAVFICAGGLFLFSVQEEHEDLDASLLHQSKIIGRIIMDERSHDGTMILLKTLLASERDHRMAEIRRAKGQITRLATHSQVPILLDAGLPLPAQPYFLTKTINGHSRRILYSSFGDNLIAVAAQPESMRENIQNVLVVYSILTVILLVIILSGGRWLANAALAPIVEMADDAARIQNFDSAQRLSINQVDAELRRLANVLNDMLDRLHSSFSLIRRFTADAAHEIKTPLTIIQGHLESTLRSEGFPPQQETTLLLTLREVERLNRLIEGLLLLSRSDANRLELQCEPVDWSELTGELLHDADILCAPLNLQLSTDIDPGIFISADRPHLRQVLLNLLDNACKYNRPGGSIRMELHSENGRARFTIGNTGPAIPDATHLFERFQRGDTSRTRGQQDGLGLGLSICREILHAHGGEIALEKSANDWTQFTVTLFKQTE